MADQLATEIIEKIKVHADTDKEITVDSKLRDLEIQSLELTDIVFDLEDSYDIRIEMDTSEAWSNLRTVSDLIEETRALIAAKD
ncbi:phosphopantetheine-binding protein [Ensifer sp. P24N7]|uniref:phosphopantetheine-binding protein n=1 Tax=Sinorhizobium sp. P24N7 TaxID=3348358 RepID=UPI0035F39981